MNKSITRPFVFSRYKYKILFRSSFTIRKSVILTLISPYLKKIRKSIFLKSCSPKEILSSQQYKHIFVKLLSMVYYHLSEFLKYNLSSLSSNDFIKLLPIIKQNLIMIFIFIVILCGLSIN